MCGIGSRAVVGGNTARMALFQVRITRRWSYKLAAFRLRYFRRGGRASSIHSSL
jgi:hypothetical protein